MVRHVLFRRKRPLVVTALVFVCVLAGRYFSRDVKGTHLEINTSSTRDILQIQRPQKSSKTDHILQTVGMQKKQNCVHPDILLYSPAIKSYLQNVPPITCAGEPDWVYTGNGRFYISSEAVKRHGQITCSYIPIVPAANDSYAVWKTVTPMLNGSVLDSDAFKVACRSVSGHTYANIQPCISPKTVTPSKTNKNTLPVNVFIFGIDSLSRHMWQRLLPKSHYFFTKVLGGQILEGYNIVGDGTPQALMPILTGHSETEIPEVRRGKPGARPVDDVLTFVWKRFQDIGYVTQWGEDMSHIGTFNQRMLGFRHQPVTHYMRPYFLSASTVYRHFKQYCMASKPRHKVFLDWFKEGLQTNKGKKLFTFSFYAELSHTDNINIQLVDDDIVQFFDFMNDSNVLNNTILVVMSDHGARYNSIRTTEQGKLEERMPYFGFRFPPWFSKKYPQEMKNFKINTHRLVTPFDIHETIIDILDHKKPVVGKVLNRAISLFNEIPSERTCSDAHIEPHYCACLDWKSTAIDSPDVIKGVNSVIKLINNMTSELSKLCHRLSLLSVENATTHLNMEDVFKVETNLDNDGRVTDFSGGTNAEMVLYQLTFTLIPGYGRFEATVKHNKETGEYTANSFAISRINVYGNEPDCIANTFPHLRTYCVCKDWKQ